MASSVLLRNSVRLINSGSRNSSTSTRVGQVAVSGFLSNKSVLSNHHQQTENKGKCSNDVRVEGHHEVTRVQSLHTSIPTQDIFSVQDEQDFKNKVVNSKKPVIVQFHASWCGPCKLLMPRMEKAMINFKNDADMAKVDIDEHPDIAMDFNVGAVPSVLAMKGGKVVDKFVGLKDDDQIDTFIASSVKK